MTKSGCRQTLGMSEIQSLSQRLLALLHGLLWIAEAPQRVGRKGMASHPRCLAIAERLGSLRHGVSEVTPLLEVRPGGCVFAQEEQGAPERVIGLQAGCGRDRALR